MVKANESVGATPEITKPAEEIEHRDIRRGPRAEFDGNVNPRTGERGGPKVDPFKAGDGDWQYGGRVTVSLHHFSRDNRLSNADEAGLLVWPALRISMH